MTTRLLAAAVVVAALASCSDGDDAGRPLVDEIGPAVEALEGELGGAVEFFEINASPLRVVMWVSADQGRRAIPYVYADGELADPEAAEEVGEGSFTFTSDDALTFDADQIFDGVDEGLDDPELTEFSILGGESGAVRFDVIVLSDEGGQLDVRLAPDGEVLEAFDATNTG